MTSQTLVSLAVLVCAAVSVTSTILPGRCPVVSVKENFDVTQYVGVWFEHRSYFNLFQTGLNCSQAKYTALDATHIRVNNTGTARDKKGGLKVNFITGTATIDNVDIPAKLSLVFDNMPNKTGQYWVVETDYQNFTIVWSCQNMAGGLFHISYSWILGRQPTPFSAAIEAQIEQALSQHNIDATLYTETVQTGCINY